MGGSYTDDLVSNPVLKTKVVSRFHSYHFPGCSLAIPLLAGHSPRASPWSLLFSSSCHFRVRIINLVTNCRNDGTSFVATVVSLNSVLSATITHERLLIIDHNPPQRLIPIIEVF